MKKAMQIITPLMLVFFMAFIGCPDKQAAETDKSAVESAPAAEEAMDKGAVEQVVEETAKEIVEAVEAPIEQAKAVKEKIEGQIEDMTKQVGDQQQELEKVADLPFPTGK